LRVLVATSVDVLWFGGGFWLCLLGWDMVLWLLVGG